MVGVAALSLVLAVQSPVARPNVGPTAAQRPDSVRSRDGWFGADKVKHFFVAAFTQSVTYAALQAARVRHDRALAGAWAVTGAASVAKELYDRRTTGVFSVRDLVWDAAGAASASVMLTQARRSAPPTDPAPSGVVSRRIPVSAWTAR
jgi:uncharacterized protein YfiM (DUF2279 family)